MNEVFCALTVFDGSPFRFGCCLAVNKVACALSLMRAHFASGVVLLCALLSAKVTGIWNVAKACCDGSAFWFGCCLAVN